MTNKELFTECIKNCFPDTSHQSKAQFLGKQLYSQSRQMYKSC